MTDKEKLSTLFRELGIGFEEDEDSILLPEGNEKITGYNMFYTRFDFDEDGKFVEVGAYE